jgi:hypothetical protein
VRLINTHVVNEANDSVGLAAIDTPSADGANHKYEIRVANTSTTLTFQKGPIGKVGVNGLTHEVLLAVLIDRLKGFQTGEFACRENALALTKLEEAVHWLNSRTRERLARGVEGTHRV